MNEVSWRRPSRQLLLPIQIDFVGALDGTRGGSTSQYLVSLGLQFWREFRRARLGLAVIYPPQSDQPQPWQPDIV